MGKLSAFASKGGILGSRQKKGKSKRSNQNGVLAAGRSDLSWLELPHGSLAYNVGDMARGGRAFCDHIGDMQSAVG